MKKYIAHTAYCSGWDLDSILEGTKIKKSIKTNQKWGDENPPKMMDWDFKNPNWEKHLQRTKKHNFEVVMAPDVKSPEDVPDVLRKVDQLKDHVPRVVIPIHYYDDRLAGYELAFPNATKFNPDRGSELPFIDFFRDEVTHVLGGSPKQQFAFARYFPSLKSLDGNMIFWAAVHYGKYWDNGWHKPDEHKTNEEIFKISVQNINKKLVEEKIKED